MGIKSRTSKNELVGASAVEVFAAYGDRLRLWLYADSANSGKVYFTVDGSTPTSTNYNYELVAGAGVLLDRAVPSNKVQVIGSASGQRYSAEEG
jgi:hypothetical protein